MRLSGKMIGSFLYVLAVASLSPQALSWDALSFLMSARAPISVDYGHAVYIPALWGANWVFGGIVGSPERSAKLFSALGAALVFLLLWRRAERAGAGQLGAATAAALFATTTLFWHEAGSIEPSTWTIGALLLAAGAAEAYGRARTSAGMALLSLSVALAIGFHLVSVCALPWIVLLAAGPAPRPPLRHYAIPAALASVVAALARRGGRLPEFHRYWMGFVPSFEMGAASALSRHLERAAELFLDGAPVLVGLGLVCGAWLVVRRPRSVGGAAALALPYSLAFLVLGKPLVGLLLPIALALGLLVCEAPGAARQLGGRGRLVSYVVSVALFAQLASALPLAFEWRNTPDRDRDQASSLVRVLPESSMLFAGPLANYVRYLHPEAPVVSLPELLHGVVRGADPIPVVRQEVARTSERFVSCYLSSDGFVYLQTIWSADPYRLDLDEKRILFVPEDAELHLIPIVSGARPSHRRE